MWLIKGTLIALMVHIASQELLEAMEKSRPAWWFLVYDMLLLCWMIGVMVVKVSQ